MHLLENNIELSIHKNGNDVYHIYLRDMIKNKEVAHIACGNEYGAHKMWIQLQLDYYDKVLMHDFKED